MSTLWSAYLLFFIVICQKCQSCQCPVYEDDLQLRCLSSVDCSEDKLIRDFCSSDFCVEALIDSDKPSMDKNLIYSNYTYHPIRTIRFTPQSIKAIRKHLFFTPTAVERCGVRVKRRAIYYFCGHVIDKNAVVTSCDFIKRTESLTFSERMFLLWGHRKMDCLQFISNFRPIIDYNVKEETENATQSELKQIE